VARRLPLRRRADVGQLEAPWADAARIGTHLLIVAVVCAVAVGGIEAAERHWAAAIGAGGFVVLVSVAGLVAPDGDRTGQITAAVVQGGGPLGTRAVDTPDEIVWERHVEATRMVSPEADLVVWPETVADVDRPLETSDHIAEVGALASELDATFAVGLNERERNTRLNVLVAVGPDGTVVDRYDKVHLVPFGEYVPLRGFVDNFADLSVIGTEIEPGTGQALLVTPAGSLAPAISFEIYFLDRVREGVQLGAELVVNSTLASSYTSSLIPEQTLASGRLRAIETGRWVLQASTTGYSAVIDHRGDVVDRTGLREQAVLEMPVDRRGGETWAVRFGQWPITLVALLLLAAPWVGPVVRATRAAGPYLRR
jgi:apolipoprotein N-acyltransferase